MGKRLQETPYGYYDFIPRRSGAGLWFRRATLRVRSYLTTYTPTAPTHSGQPTYLSPPWAVRDILWPEKHRASWCLIRPSQTLRGTVASTTRKGGKKYCRGRESCRDPRLQTPTWKPPRRPCVGAMHSRQSPSNLSRSIPQGSATSRTRCRGRLGEGVAVGGHNQHPKHPHGTQLRRGNLSKRKYATVYQLEDIQRVGRNSFIFPKP